MAVQTIGRIMLSCALLGSIAGTAYAAQEKKTQKGATAANSQSGAEIYRKDCASCHGDNLKGGGPAPYPYRVPPDLTKLARSHGGKFPDTYVSTVLRSGVVLPEHGPAQMPVWGTDLSVGDRKNLIAYVKSHQTK